MHHHTQNEKRYVSDMHILMFYKNLGISFDVNIILGVKNPR